MSIFEDETPITPFILNLPPHFDSIFTMLEEIKDGIDCYHIGASSSAREPPENLLWYHGYEELNDDEIKHVWKKEKDGAIKYGSYSMAKIRMRMLTRYASKNKDGDSN